MVVHFLLFMESYITAVTCSQNLFYGFDSHSRDKRGLDTANGRSVLLKFRYIFEIEKYIQVAYLVYREKQQLYFQAQFIRIKEEAIGILLICFDHKRIFKRNYNPQHCQKNSPNDNKRKILIYSEKFGLAPHDKLKANMKLHNDQVHVQGQVDQIEATSHTNMESKRKISKLFYDTVDL